MIKFTLKCDNGHIFDSWFQSSDAFDKLKASDLITCSVCGGAHVEKAVMAPRVSTSRTHASLKAPPKEPALSAPASEAEKAVAELKRHVEKNSENVGDNFARVARAIHSGEQPERSIYGQAKPEEARALLDDGVPVAPLPWGNRRTN